MLPPIFKPTIATTLRPAPLYNPIPAHIQNHQPKYRCYVLIFAIFGENKAVLVCPADHRLRHAMLLAYDLVITAMVIQVRS